MNILEEVQIYVADRLNADSELSGLCPFIFENKKDIDYEIKSALGKQGLVGLVMTPKATFAGAFEDMSLAWQLDELEIDIIENVTVNRGKKNGYVTGQDAAMRLFEVLCPLSGENEGMFNPVSYEEGEDNNLLVNKCVLKCLAHHFEEPVPPPPPETSTRYLKNGQWYIEDWEGTLTRDASLYLSDVQEVVIGTAISSIGMECFHPNNGQTTLSSVTIPETVTSIGQSAFGACKSLSSLDLPNQLSSIDNMAFSDLTAIVDFEIPDSVVTIGDNVFMGCRNLKNVVIGSGVQSMGMDVFQEDSPDCVLFKGKTLAQVQAMENYPWGLRDSSVISAELPALSNCWAVYEDGTKREWHMPTSIFTFNDVNVNGLVHLQVQEGIISMGVGALRNAEELSSITLPSTLVTIADQAFSNCSNLQSIVLPTGTQTIYDSVFTYCSGLRTVTIPYTVTSIGEDSFWNCTSVTDVYCWPDPSNLTWEDGDYDDFKEDGSTLCHVRSEWLEAYRQKFGNTVNVTFVGDLS